MRGRSAGARATTGRSSGGVLPVFAVVLTLALVPGGLPGPAVAQEGPPEPAASVADFGWMEGTWRGPGPQGSTAEVHFMEPSAGVLPAAFRLVQDGRVVVLEFFTLVEEDDGIHMYVRHFSPALRPMEEERAIDLRLEERRGDRSVFTNVREENPTVTVMTREGRDSFVSMSELARPDGSADTIRVEYRRADGDASSGGG
jgi:hypothetical protein